MMDRSSFLYKYFLDHFTYEPTSCQENLLRDMSDFFTSDDGDIMVVNGYAGTGKTTAVAAVVNSLKELETPCILLAPTGRSAKVLSSYTGHPAFTIHKHIYRQKSHGDDGFGLFTLGPNKSKNTLFIVDEVSLIGIDSQSSGAAFGSGNLLEDLVNFVRSGVDCRLVLIGDSAQLPPIGLDASPALSPEFMEGFGGVKYSGLKEVVRQQKESGILWNATRIRELITSDPYGGATFTPDEIGLRTEGFDDIKRITGGELLDTLNQAYFTDYSKDDAIVLCRSNKRANRYNAGIRAQVLYDEERLVRGEKLMIVKNCYQFTGGIEGMDYIANGDIAKLVSIKNFEERYGLSFADARLSFPDYDDAEITAKVCLDTLSSEAASLTYEQQNMLYNGVNEDYSHLTTKKKRYEACADC